MVDDLLRKLEDVASTVKKEKKDLSLFAVVKMDDASDGWSILVSRPGLDGLASRRALFRYVVDLLVKRLGVQELADIARVGVLPLEEHLVDDLLKYKKGHITQPFKANGNIVYEAYILESK